MGDPRDEEEEGGEDDDLLSSLAEELVWKGGDQEEGEDEDEEYEEGELDGQDLESLGISIMVSPTGSVCFVDLSPLAPPPGKRLTAYARGWKNAS